MKRSKVVTLVGAFALALSVGAAQAAPYTYEGFDYTAGEQVGWSTPVHDGGTGWAAAWDGATQGAPIVADSGLTYTDGGGNALVTTGKGLLFDDGPDDAGRTLASGISAGSEAWFSVLLDGAAFGVDSGLATEWVLYDSSGAEDDTSLQVWSRDRGYGGMWEIALSANGDADYFRDLNGDSYPVPTGTILLVAHIDNEKTTAGQVTADVWVNPSDITGSDLGTPFASLTVAGDGSQTYDRLYIHNSGGWGELDVTYDEIRFGDTLADVTPVPEPLTVALMGVGGAIVALRRRRKA